MHEELLAVSPVKYNVFLLPRLRAAVRLHSTPGSRDRCLPAREGVATPPRGAPARGPPSLIVPDFRIQFKYTPQGRGEGSAFWSPGRVEHYGILERER